MSDFGAKLREARERRGVSLRAISDHTKISIPVLESLERNDPSRLPGGVFTRAAVRSYASQVGLDPDATVREFLIRFDLEPPMTAAAPIPEPRLDSGDAHRLAAVLIKVVVASLVAVAILLYLTRARQPDESGNRSPDSTRRTSRRVGLNAVPKPPELP